ncbi:MAG: transpeptidase family protein [Deltaproteobacteria bacterium]|nr:transpeptidase family protein [Deltaproteobacteria bacterium]
MVFALVIARAMTLHLTRDAKLRNLATHQYNRKINLAPRRGNIFDSKGGILATDIKVDSVFVHPHLVEDKDKFIREVAMALDLKPSEVEEKLDPEKRFVWIKRRIEQTQSEKVRSLQFKGLGIIKESKRLYPNAALAANLLGAVGYDSKALSGVELAYDSFLKTQDQPILVETDAKGRPFDSEALMSTFKPKSIKLTLDKTIQYIAEKELQEVVERKNARGGIALVMDIHTGAILAMASYPTFDPNRYWEFPQDQWRNRNITDSYEPGSIFKIITAAAALELLGMNKNSSMFCENGAYPVGKHVIHDHGRYGQMTLAMVIKKSSNICSYKISQKLGKERFYKFVKKLGFGETTKIDIPGEIRGILNPLDRMSEVQMGTIAFGQGISVTPLQLIAAYSAVANGGHLMRPYLVQEIMDHEGNTLQKTQAQVVSEVLSKEHSKELVEMLVGVVEPGGTGTQAAVDGYIVGGKTGTAQKVIEGKKGYASNKYIASFVGIAPAKDPKIAVLVSVDEPKGDYYGGTVSAPTFSKITQQTLAYLAIPQEATVKVVKNEKDKNKKDKQGKKETVVAEGFGVTDKTNPSEDLVVKKAVAEELETTDLIKVPDLQGLSLREAIRTVEAKSLRAKMQGSGMLVSQEPEAGVLVNKGTEIVLNFEPI